MSAPITAAVLYDLVNCPHRVTMDAFGDPAERDPINAFVELLWKRGSAFEDEVITDLTGKTPFVNLRLFAGAEKEQKTLEAMKAGAPLIYGGRLAADDLLGDPDLLRREGDGYIPGDIKSGRGEEGGDEENEGKPKLHYAVQLALYVDLLERLKFSAGRRGYILDVDRTEVIYDLTTARGPKTPGTLWDEYQAALAEAREIYAQSEKTLPAYASSCKLCHWYSSCLKSLQKAGDLTLIPRLGRSARDTLAPTFPTLADLADANPDGYLKGKDKTIFPRIGLATLKTFIARAKLLTTPGAKAYLKTPVSLPTASTELFFDIEADPMRDICYLHGFVVRKNGDTASEKFIAFFADNNTPEAEREAFAQAIEFFRNSQPAVMFYYSKYERTFYRKLQARYPDVCTADEIETLFKPATAIDLYNDVVTKATEWPTRDHSIKTLASHLGFRWRDPNPSGAASIEWYHRWVDTKDTAVKQRILDYNEDDCRATRVLLDGIRGLTG
jgi:predicted RecB family nuclease